ncbi:MAG: hemolysin family protein [bacterium]
MDPSDPWSFGMLLLLLFASAFFSAAETALTIVKKHEIKDWTEEDSPQADAVAKLLNKRNQVLGTILVGNNLANILLAVLGTVLSLRLYGERTGPGIAVGGLLLLIIGCGEIAPKVITAANADKVAVWTAKPLLWLTFFLYPIVRFVTAATNVSVRLFGGTVQQGESYLTEEELRTMVNVGQREGVLETTEKEMIHNIFEFGDTFVRDVMVPRADAVCVEAEITYAELAEIFKEEQFSRVPVYEDSIDNIIGIVYVKDLFDLDTARKQSFRVADYVREAYFVPEMKRIDGLFKEMRESKVHMAVVLDEYGGTAGIVTIEDLVEEIVGDIADEYDQEPLPAVEKVDERTYILDAGLRIEEVNALLTVSLPNHDIDTIGGFVLSRLERIPEENDVVEWDGFKITILSMEGRRITRIKVTQQEAE